MHLLAPLLRSCVFAAALGAVSESSIADPQPLAVTVNKPIAKRITTWDEYSGRFVAVRSVEVRARVSGFIDKVNFTDGAIVRQGDLLFTIDKRPFELAVEASKADVARAVAQVSLATADVDRAKPLVNRNVLSGRDFDQRAASLAVAQAQLMAAEAALRTSELNLEWTEVRAPIEGRISDKKVNEGNLVNGGSGSTTLLATIVSIDPIHFVFEASESDYLRYVRANLSGKRPSSRNTSNPIRVRLADEKEFAHQGKMDFVDNQVDSNTGTIRGRAILENQDQLLTPGVFGRIQLFGGDVDAILIPDQAIISDQARKIVFALDSHDVLVSKPVELGPMHEGLRVVVSGLSTHDRVVVDGIANPAVRPGVKVKPEDAETKSASN